MLPFNFRSAVGGGLEPSGLGVPTNVGQLRASGVELWLEERRASRSTRTTIRAFSSSASQFAYNDLNAPAIAAGHLFPVGYVPDLHRDAAYELALAKRPRAHHAVALVRERLSRTATARWRGSSTRQRSKPVHVRTTTTSIPARTTTFLRNPSQPYERGDESVHRRLSGTPEGHDPNTLRSPPQMLVNLHVEGDLTPAAHAHPRRREPVRDPSRDRVSGESVPHRAAGLRGRQPVTTSAPTAQCWPAASATPCHGDSARRAVRARQRRSDQRRRDAIGAVDVRHGRIRPAELSAGADLPAPAAIPVVRLRTDASLAWHEDWFAPSPGNLASSETSQLNERR